MNPKFLILGYVLVLPSLCYSDESKFFDEVKTHYDFFNPTPDRLLREMSVGCDTTKTPYTVDAGHLKFEHYTAAYHYSFGTDTSLESGTLAVGSAVMTLGLTNSIDFGFSFPAYDWSLPGESATHGGESFALNIRKNLMGNDEGDFALSLVGSVLASANARLATPISVNLSEAWTLTSMIEAGSSMNALANLDQRHLETQFTFSIWRELSSRMESYVENVWSYSFEDGAGLSGFFGAGSNYKFTNSFKLLFGITAGIVNHQPQVGGTMGFAIRL